MRSKKNNTIFTNLSLCYCLMFLFRRLCHKCLSSVLPIVETIVKQVIQPGLLSKITLKTYRKLTSKHIHVYKTLEEKTLNIVYTPIFLGFYALLATTLKKWYRPEGPTSLRPSSKSHAAQYTGWYRSSSSCCWGCWDCEGVSFFLLWPGCCCFTEAGFMICLGSTLHREMNIIVYLGSI